MTSRLWVILGVAGVVALAAGLGIGMALAGDDHGPGDGPHAGGGAWMEAPMGSWPDGGMGSGMAGGGRLGERAFLQMMVPHHRSAVAMAELALERAERPAVRRLAERIVASQEEEIERMRTWSEQWFGEPLTEDASGPHASMDMSGLEATPAREFDRAFLAAMIPHHASALMMADAALRGGPRGELERMAHEIIAAQAEEIGQMQRWRQTWFPPLG
ncbi:DUF305 domain-containing protein [Miltoncostaea marina]|uniref:DUF305 domain-containing protein n=1 Tax=Miltoncostaea marina TaxID=2843215 RepID=UPI001C3E68C2|nr:DUF305 domain-containing protein [Miltoncostaea marina]